MVINLIQMKVVDCDYITGKWVAILIFTVLGIAVIDTIFRKFKNKKK